MPENDENEENQLNNNEFVVPDHGVQVQPYQLEHLVPQLETADVEEAYNLVLDAVLELGYQGQPPVLNELDRSCYNEEGADHLRLTLYTLYEGYVRFLMPQTIFVEVEEVEDVPAAVQTVRVALLNMVESAEVTDTNVVEDGIRVTYASMVVEPGYQPGSTLLDGYLPMEDNGAVYVKALVESDPNTETEVPTPDEWIARWRDLAREQGVVNPTLLVTTFVKDGGRLEGDGLQAALRLADRTLTRFGSLAILDTVIEDDKTTITYLVLEEALYPTALVEAQLLGWGGQVDFPGVGKVTASLTVQ